MRIVTHNQYVGNGPAAARSNAMDLIEETDFPTLVPLQESRLARDIPGYTRLAVDRGHQDNNNCVLLVRKKGVQIKKVHVVRPKGWWVGPKHGLHHPPRIFIGATIFTEGMFEICLDIHGIPNRGRNPAAARSEWATLENWANSRMWGRPLDMVGDWNADDEDERLVQFARETHTTPALVHIDGTLHRNHKRRPLIHRLASKFGSDGHRPIILDY